MKAQGDMRRALIEGLCDGAGFFFGALVGWWIGRLLGWDVTASGDWGLSQTLGLLLVLVGCALGRTASHRVKVRLLREDRP